jgi:hypothetical protein
MAGRANCPRDLAPMPDIIGIVGKDWTGKQKPRTRERREKGEACFYVWLHCFA